MSRRAAERATYHRDFAVTVRLSEPSISDTEVAIRREGWNGAPVVKRTQTPGLAGDVCYSCERPHRRAGGTYNP